MADTATSSLAALTSLASGDLFFIVDVSDTSMAGTGTSKKATAANVVTSLISLGLQASLTAGTDYLTATALAAAYQAKDADLTAIAALTTTSFGRSLLTQADAAAARTTLGTGDGTVTTFSLTTANGVSGSVANATTTPALTVTLGAITPTTVNGNTFTTGTYTLTGTAGKTLTFTNTLTLAGTDGSTLTIGAGGTLGTAAYTASASYQPIDSDLTAIAALTTTSFGRGLLTETDAASARTTLGVGSGSGDVTAGSAFAADNRLVRSDGTSKGVQGSGITVDDSDNMSGVAALTVTGAATAATFVLGATTVTATGTELNYVSGVTSAIQTQLNAKQASDAALTALAAGSDFVQFTGPTTSTKVFTLPNASSTLLYSGGALGTPSSGSAANLTSIPSAQISGVIPIANLATGTPTGSKFIRDDGTLQVPAGGGGGSVATDTIFDAAGDLVVGTGADTSARLAVGGLGATLRSDGTTPYWATLSNTIEFRDDFFSGQASSIDEKWAAAGTLNFGDFGAGVGPNANHWGVARFRSTGADQSLITGGSAGTQIVLGSGVVWVEWIIRTPATSADAAAVSDGTDTYTLLVGLGDTVTSSAQTDGVYFRYTHSVNSGKWERVTESNTSEDPQDTGTTYAGATWIRLGILITNGTSAQFFIDGSSVGTNSTGANIPTGTSRTLGLVYMFDRTAGTAERNMYVDAVHLVYKPNTPR